MPFYHYTVKLVPMVLSRDVPNPKPDRRRHEQRAWRSREVWPKGMRLTMETFDIGKRFGMPEREGTTARTLRPSNGLCGDDLIEYHKENEAQWKALTEALVEETPSVRTVLEYHGIDSNPDSIQVRILNKLLSEHFVSDLSGIDALVKSIVKDMEVEDAAATKKDA